MNAGGQSRIEETTPHNGDINALAIFFYEPNITHWSAAPTRFLGWIGTFISDADEFAYRCDPRPPSPPMSASRSSRPARGRLSGDGWLHEIKHDGHRLVVAILPGDGRLMLLSRNGYDRTRLFREPFRPMLDVGLPAMVLDGEIAVPDDRGVTHLDALNQAIADRRPERLAYFAFDLLHLDGHDLRRCPIKHRKMLLQNAIGTAGCEQIVYVDHVQGIGKELFEAGRQIGAEGIVSKRRSSAAKAGNG